jgi:hypothetical protein
VVLRRNRLYETGEKWFHSGEFSSAFSRMGFYLIKGEADKSPRSPKRGPISSSESDAESCNKANCAPRYEIAMPLSDKHNLKRHAANWLGNIR